VLRQRGRRVILVDIHHRVLRPPTSRQILYQTTG